MSTIETDRLLKLYERLIDSRDGYRKAADTAEFAQYKTLFETRSRQREDFAAKVGSELVQRDESFDPSGSAGAAAHRFWTDISSTIGDTDRAVAREVRRGEEKLLDTYRDILDDAEVTDPLYAELNRERAEIAKMVEMTEEISA